MHLSQDSTHVPLDQRDWEQGWHPHFVAWLTDVANKNRGDNEAACGNIKGPRCRWNTQVGGFTAGRHSGCGERVQEVLESRTWRTARGVRTPAESIVWKAEREKSFKERSGETNPRIHPLDLTCWNFGVSSLIIYMQKNYTELLRLGNSEYKLNRTSKNTCRKLIKKTI